ncbi:MAG: glycine cleavage T C-terminal barrel domain-containing protein [Candidatus Acidiferrales bacterium]
MDSKPQSERKLGETPLREREEALGASFAEYFDCQMPERFTSFDDEYRIARESIALVDKNYRAFLRFTGPDRERYLNAILTNDVRLAQNGVGVPALLLNVQGHILAELEVYAIGDAHLVVSYAMIREKLIAALDRYIIMDDVTLEDASGQFGAIGVEGPATAEVLRDVSGVDLNALAELGRVDSQIASIPVGLVRRSPGNSPGFECVVDRGRVAELWDVLLESTRAKGGGPIGYGALNTLRLEAGVPWFGYDFDESVIPQEAGLENTHVSFSKGCYTGQEIVERVRSRGHVNRMRVGFEFSGSTLPEQWSKLTAGGKEVGHITRAGFSPSAGHVIGMGYIRREHSAPGSEVGYAGGTAKVIELPVIR